MAIRGTGDATFDLHNVCRDAVAGIQLVAREVSILRPYGTKASKGGKRRLRPQRGRRFNWRFKFSTRFEDPPEPADPYEDGRFVDEDFPPEPASIGESDGVVQGSPVGREVDVSTSGTV